DRRRRGGLAAGGHTARQLICRRGWRIGRIGWIGARHRVSDDGGESRGYPAAQHGCDPHPGR
ncbi:MAG TPA: hypothetical protein VFV02_17685, partial [Acidimicrobiales bacterium]|nr:hypothetical protein [Acidimicrobiales bacterium]